MASSLMHLAIAEHLLDGIARPDLFRLGCVLPDACGPKQPGHYRSDLPYNRKIYDLDLFRATHPGFAQDDLALGYYMHLVQDMLHRRFVYITKEFAPQTPENAAKLHNDYRMLNPMLVESYHLAPLTLPQDVKDHPLIPAGLDAFLADMAGQFEPYPQGEYFFFTPDMTVEYINFAVRICREELAALRAGKPGLDPKAYAYLRSSDIREMRPEEYPLLRDFLYEAIFQRPGDEPLPRDIVDNPELRVYFDTFGQKPLDFAVCAEVAGQVVGAVWVQDIPAYGHVEDGVPEFAISVLPELRGLGLGSKMMRKMRAVLKNAGVKRATLAVQKDNYALRMYQKTGFTIIGENEQEYIMEIHP